MQKVLVTGGAGFIGSHLCDWLIDNNYQVNCLDNLITGSLENIKHLNTNKNFKFIQADIATYKEGTPEVDFDYIFHLASPASPIDYQEYPEETLLTNSIGTVNVLNLAKRNPKTKVLIASTSEIYGDPKQHPQKESYWGNVNSFGPRSCYDESKRFAEAASYVFFKKYNLNVRIVRIFNTYGPRMQKDDGRVISNFINQAIKGQHLTVYGKGDQTRSFCFVSDMVFGITKAMFSQGTKGEVFNLGNPDEYTILQLSEKIKQMTHSKSEVSYKNLPEDDPQQRQPDISKAKKVLGWEPKVSLEDGLEETIRYYKSNS